MGEIQLSLSGADEQGCEGGLDAGHGVGRGHGRERLLRQERPPLARPAEVQKRGEVARVLRGWGPCEHVSAGSDASEVQRRRPPLAIAAALDPVGLVEYHVSRLGGDPRRDLLVGGEEPLIVHKQDLGAPLSAGHGADRGRRCKPPHGLGPPRLERRERTGYQQALNASGHPFRFVQGVGDRGLASARNAEVGAVRQGEQSAQVAQLEWLENVGVQP
jgi:hypothetical protein